MNVFVTGTDTGCGKTFVSSALIRHLCDLGMTVTGMKPVATGAEWDGDLLVNEDVAELLAASNANVAARDLNPYLFEPPTSPHIAAAAAGRAIELDIIVEAYARLARAAECVVVEGVGGWRVPLSSEYDVEDLAMALNLPVLLVVGVKLGCINHARLSHEAITGCGVPYLGWVANVLEDDLYEPRAVFETLTAALGGEPLATCRHNDADELQTVARHIVAAIP